MKESYWDKVIKINRIAHFSSSLSSSTRHLIVLCCRWCLLLTHRGWEKGDENKIAWQIIWSHCIVRFIFWYLKGDLEHCSESAAIQQIHIISIEIFSGKSFCCGKCLQFLKIIILLFQNAIFSDNFQNLNWTGNSILNIIWRENKPCVKLIIQNVLWEMNRICGGFVWQLYKHIWV